MAEFLLLSKLIYSQVPGIRKWESSGGTLFYVSQWLPIFFLNEHYYKIEERLIDCMLQMIYCDIMTWDM